MIQLPHIADWFINFGAIHDYLIYLVIVIVAFAEGPWISLILGVLLRLNFFYFWPIYISLMLGDLIGDVVWYYIGKHYGHGFISRHGKRFNITEDGVTRMTDLFHRHKYKVLFLSKITNGLGLALVTLMTAGMVRIPFAQYIAVNIVGQLAWTGFLLGIGFFFSNLYIMVDNILGKISITAVLIVVVILGFRYFRYLKAKVQKI